MQEQKKENTSLEYALAELTEQFKKQICDLKEKYGKEKRKLISTRLNSMASDLRERSDIVLSPEFEETPSNMEEKIKDASLFITIYKNLNKESLDLETKKMIDRKYDDALKKQKSYENLLRFKGRITEEREAGVLFIQSNDDFYLYPSMFHEDTEKSPSLMLNLLEYCLISCENAKIPVEVPEKDNVYLRIKLNTKSRRDQNRLLHLLNSAEPDGFKKANLKFIVLREEDYTLEPTREVSTQPEKSEVSKETGGYSVTDAIKMLGIPPSDWKAFYGVLKKKGIELKKKKMLRGKIRPKKMPVKVISEEDFEIVRKELQSKKVIS